MIGEQLWNRHINIPHLQSSSFHWPRNSDIYICLVFLLVLLYVVHRKNFFPTAQLSEALGSLHWTTLNSESEGAQVVWWLWSESWAAGRTDIARGGKILIWVYSRNSSPCFQQSAIASLLQTKYSFVFSLPQALRFESVLWVLKNPHHFKVIAFSRKDEDIYLCLWGNTCYSWSSCYQGQ